eukprot:11338425-Karenia_brevis.AAC.1
MPSLPMYGIVECELWQLKAPPTELRALSSAGIVFHMAETYWHASSCCWSLTRVGSCTLPAAK